ESRQLAAARAPCVHSAVQLTRDAIKADAQQLALRSYLLLVRAAGQDERPAPRDQPADPRADRTVDAYLVAARNVTCVIVTPGADVDHGCPGVHHLRHLVSLEGSEWRKRAPDQRRPSPVDRRHVAVVGRVAGLRQLPSEERHLLGGLKERIRLALVAEGRLVPAPSADAAEGSAAMG